MVPMSKLFAELTKVGGLCEFFFCKEFGMNEFDDYAEALFQLRQKGSTKDYINEFHRLAKQIQGISPEIQKSAFIVGFKREL